MRTVDPVLKATTTTHATVGLDSQENVVKQVHYLTRMMSMGYHLIHKLSLA